MHRIVISDVSSSIRELERLHVWNIVSYFPQMRWNPFDIPKSKNVDFVEGLNTVCGAGDPKTKLGLAVYVYACTASMRTRSFYNADGDFLIGTCKLQTLSHSHFTFNTAIKQNE